MVKLHQGLSDFLERTVEIHTRIGYTVIPTRGREHSHKQSDVLFLNAHLLTELLWEAAADTGETAQRSLTHMPRLLGERVLGKHLKKKVQ